MVIEIFFGKPMQEIDRSALLSHLIFTFIVVTPLSLGKQIAQKTGIVIVHITLGLTVYSTVLKHIAHKHKSTGHVICVEVISIHHNRVGFLYVGESVNEILTKNYHKLTFFKKQFLVKANFVMGISGLETFCISNVNIGQMIDIRDAIENWRW